MEIDEKRSRLRAQFQETRATLLQRITQATVLMKKMSLKPESREAQLLIHHLQGAEVSLKKADAALQGDNFPLVHAELSFVDLELREVEYLMREIRSRNN